VVSLRARPIAPALPLPATVISQINSALDILSQRFKTVALAAGTVQPSAAPFRFRRNVTLAARGANQTILSANWCGGGYVVALGSGGPQLQPGQHHREARATDRPALHPPAMSIGNHHQLVSGDAPKLNNPRLRLLRRQATETSDTWCAWACGPVVEAWLAARLFRSHRRQRLDPSPLAGIVMAPNTQSPIAVRSTCRPCYRRGGKPPGLTPTNKGYLRLTSDSPPARYCWVKGVEGNYTDGDSWKTTGLSRRDPRQLLLQRVPARTRHVLISDCRHRLQDQRYSGR